jgi:hypothetical protein
LRANWVGTLLAVFGFVAVPWSAALALTGRSWFVVSLERTLTVVVAVFVALMLLRWVGVVALIWWSARFG